MHRWETQPPEEGGRRTGTVLVVDDDGNLRRLARTVLAGEGYAVLEAADGPGALDAALRHRPDVVLLDVAMPAMDGVQVCRRLRENPATAAIAVVMVTADAGPRARQRASEAGADDLLLKPFSIEELLRAIRGSGGPR